MESIKIDKFENCYKSWPRPTAIICDGPYGIPDSGYSGDNIKISDLVNFYDPILQIFSRSALASTTLWFWSTEIGWATVHPCIVNHGWEYRGINIWNKGKACIAGRCNSKTMRKFPVVTEVCAHYTRRETFKQNDNELTMQDWLRNEWVRSGLPLSLANHACGVKNAATRKWLTSDHLWYMPSSDAVEKLAIYANEFGDPAGRPYFDFSAATGLSFDKYDLIRAKFKLPHGITNVWDYPPLSAERIKVNNVWHPNQKPLELVKRIILCSTDNDDAVWEPFGGTCPGLSACINHNRNYFASECNIDYLPLINFRLRAHERSELCLGPMN